MLLIKLHKEGGFDFLCVYYCLFAKLTLQLLIEFDGCFHRVCAFYYVEPRLLFANRVSTRLKSMLPLKRTITILVNLCSMANKA